MNKVIRILAASRPSALRAGQKVILRVRLRGAAARRSATNILQWNTYLPADCVRAMVSMGWDYTT